MKLPSEHKAEYDAGLADIAALLKTHIQRLVQEARDDARNRGPLPFDDYIRLHEDFLWPNLLLKAAQDLQGEKSLKEVFARVSLHYRAENPNDMLGRVEDLSLSDAARHDGRRAAFEQMTRILDVAARDFDLSAAPPGFRQLAYWHRRAPDADYTRDPMILREAWRNGRREAMDESLRQLRYLLRQAEEPEGFPGAVYVKLRPDS